MVTDLTSQYLIKIMQPKYRIHLATLFEYYKKNNTKIFVIENSTYVDGEKRNELQDFLKSIFEGSANTVVESFIFSTSPMPS